MVKNALLHSTGSSVKVLVTMESIKKAPFPCTIRHTPHLSGPYGLAGILLHDDPQKWRPQSVERWFHQWLTVIAKESVSTGVH